MLANDPLVDPFAMVEKAIVQIPRPQHDPIFSRALGQFVQHIGAREVLELGTGHGGSACWLATALRLNGGGTLTTVDRDTAPAATPLLESAGVADLTRVVRTPRSYTAELMRLIRANTTDDRCNPQFDLCFIDGAHNWDTDGFAFFLVEKLLRPGGWLLMDDLDWTYAQDPSRSATDGIVHRELSERERTEPHLRAVFDLIVAQHPSFTELRLQDADEPVS